MYAQRFGQATPMPSMQFCIENLDQAGGCTYNYSCAYTDSISWASPNEPLPMIRDPRVAFDLLFGVGRLGARTARSRRETRRSILDWISSRGGRRAQGARHRRPRAARPLPRPTSAKSSAASRPSKRATAAASTRELPGRARPGVPDSFSEHMKLMFDLQVLALETDMTRIISFKTGRDSQNRVFPESGSNQPFHPASHHGNREDRILEFNKISQVPRQPAGLLPRQAEEHAWTATRACSTRR